MPLELTVTCIDNDRRNVLKISHANAKSLKGHIEDVKVDSNLIS